MLIYHGHPHRHSQTLSIHIIPSLLTSILGNYQICGLALTHAYDTLRAHTTSLYRSVGYLYGPVYLRYGWSGHGAGSGWSKSLPCWRGDRGWAVRIQISHSKPCSWQTSAQAATEIFAMPRLLKLLLQLACQQLSGKPWTLSMSLPN